MYVVKRDGRQQPVMFDKITARVRHLCPGLDRKYVDPVRVAQKARSLLWSDPAPRHVAGFARCRWCRGFIRV